MIHPRRRLLLAVLTMLMAGPLWPAADAWARQSMSFLPGDRTHFHTHAHAHVAPYHLARRSRRGQRVAARPMIRTSRRGNGEDEGAAARAVPGAGFTMQDGVLTYPAPARFQPQNLKHR